MASEKPFKIIVSDDALALLKRKLDDTCLPDEVKEAEWAYGVPLADIRRLVSRWKDGYDWRAHERELNVLPMFTRTIEVGGFFFFFFLNQFIFRNTSQRLSPVVAMSCYI
jgi:hypothetical protein